MASARDIVEEMHRNSVETMTKAIFDDIDSNENTARVQAVEVSLSTKMMSVWAGYHPLLTWLVHDDPLLALSSQHSWSQQGSRRPESGLSLARYHVIGLMNAVGVFGDLSDQNLSTFVQDHRVVDCIKNLIRSNQDQSIASVLEKLLYHVFVFQNIAGDKDDKLL